MSVCFEKPDSRRSKKDGVRSTYQTTWRLKDYVTSAAAYAAMLAKTPPTVEVDGVLLNSITPSLNPVGKVGNYDGVVNYKHSSQTPHKQTPVATDDEKLSFSYSGPSTFFTRAITQTIHGPDAKDFGVALNVAADNRTIQGMEIQLPDSGFQVKKKLNIGSTATEKNDWISDRIDQLHTTNDDTFRGRPAEDHLFTRFSGEELDDGDFDITFEFVTIKSEDYTVPDSFEAARETFSIGKIVPGFHIIWVHYIPLEMDLPGNETLIYPKAQGVYVAKVFETSAFGDLGVTV